MMARDELTEDRKHDGNRIDHDNRDRSVRQRGEAEPEKDRRDKSDKRTECFLDVGIGTATAGETAADLRETQEDKRDRDRADQVSKYRCRPKLRGDEARQREYEGPLLS